VANISHVAVELCLCEQLLSLFQSVTHFLLPSLLAVHLPGLPALLAALRRVSKTLLMEELLLTARPGEFLLTINARSCLVFKPAHLFPSSYPSSFYRK
jgi:hypothetical protein